ncbi:hypothetical protein BDN70DRAFT_440588 [Pholiota conissans]|uniref:Uncharacterized protein n=1 Tax=Pholiota conissans TaxID=109636 RepID=A0A9P5YQ92_9AGAR|nr:hypothetical protein BDN70DRAFT_440588 [Pholiota conissans]
MKRNCFMNREGEKMSGWRLATKGLVVIGLTVRGCDTKAHLRRTNSHLLWSFLGGDTEKKFTVIWERLDGMHDRVDRAIEPAVNRYWLQTHAYVREPCPARSPRHGDNDSQPILSRDFCYLRLEFIFYLLHRPPSHYRRFSSTSTQFETSWFLNRRKRIRGSPEFLPRSGSMSYAGFFRRMNSLSANRAA